MSTPLSRFTPRYGVRLLCQQQQQQFPIRLAHTQQVKPSSPRTGSRQPTTTSSSYSSTTTTTSTPSLPPLFRRRTAERPLPQLSPLFTAFYLPTHTIPLPAQTILEASQHPRRTATLRRYAARPRDGLWWYVKSPVAVCAKRVVRSWAQRRVRDAFVEVLARRGLDCEGRVLGKGSGVGGRNTRGTSGGRREEDGRKGLVGSLRVHVFEPVLRAKMTEIVAGLERLVDKLEDMREGGKGRKGGK